MANNIPDYRVTSPSEYKTANGEVKTFYMDVGSAWKIKNGGIAIKLRPNIAVSGELVVFVPKEREADDEESDDGSLASREVPDDEIPF